jgi:hypothetical protein
MQGLLNLAHLKRYRRRAGVVVGGRFGLPLGGGQR